MLRIYLILLLLSNIPWWKDTVIHLTSSPINGHLGVLQFFTNANDIIKIFLTFLNSYLCIPKEVCLEYIFCQEKFLAQRKMSLFNSRKYAQTGLFKNSNSISSNQHCLKMPIFLHTAGLFFFLNVATWHKIFLN